MASSEPEIKIKVTADASEATPSLGGFEKLLEETAAQSAAASKALQAASRDAEGMADALALMRQRARATGAPEAAEAVRAAFSGSAEGIVSFGEQAESLGARLAKIPAAAEAVRSGFEQGNLTLEQAVQLAGRLAGAAQDAAEKANGLASGVELAKFDFAQARGLDELLAQFVRLGQGIGMTAAHAADVQGEAQRMAESLHAQRAALDPAAEGFERQAAALMSAAAGYGKIAARAADAGARLDGLKAKAGAAMGALGGAGGVEKAAKALAGLGEAARKEAAKLEEAGEGLAVADQKRAAAGEKAAEAAAKAGEKRQAAAEKAMQAAAAAGEREAELAGQARQRAEDERFALGLAAKAKAELAAETQRLIAAQKEAAKAGNAEAYAQYARRISLARKALAGLAKERSLAKIQWMQQAQTAMMLGQQAEAVGASLSSLGEDMKEGRLNVSGMTSAIMSMAYAMKAGLGPIGWVMMAVEGLQMAFNALAGSEQGAREKLRQGKRAALEAAEAHRKAEESLSLCLKRQQDVAQQAQLEGYYKRLNDSIREQERLVSRVTQAELRRRALKEGEEDHGLAMEQLRLERQAAEGRVSQEEYAERLLALEERRAVLAADRKAAAAGAEAARLAKLESVAHEEVARKEAKYAEELRAEEGFEASPDEVRQLYAANGLDDVARKMEAALKAGDKGEYHALKHELAGRRAMFLPGRAKDLDEEGYKAQYEAVRRRTEAARQELAEAERKRSSLREEREEAEERAGLEERAAAQQKRQARELHAQKSANNEAKAKAEAEDKKRQESLRRKREAVAAMDDAALEGRRIAALRKAGKTQNDRQRQHWQAVAGVYSGEQVRRRSVRREFAAQGYSGKELENLAWLETQGKALAGKGRPADAEAKAVLRRFQEVMETKSTQDDALLLRLIRSLELTTDQVQRLGAGMKAKVDALERKIRATARNAI